MEKRVIVIFQIETDDSDGEVNLPIAVHLRIKKAFLDPVYGSKFPTFRYVLLSSEELPAGKTSSDAARKAMKALKEVIYE